jgi:hypothetical protein
MRSPVPSRDVMEFCEIERNRFCIGSRLRSWDIEFPGKPSQKKGRRMNAKVTEEAFIWTLIFGMGIM